MKHKKIILLFGILSFLLVSIIWKTNYRAYAQTIDANLKVAFIGDSGAGSDFQSVLNLIKNENTHMVLHQGDFDYSDGPQKWMDMINSTLGSNFPYLLSDGNHDEWSNDGYADFAKDRMQKMGQSVPSGELPPSYSAVYRGLKMVFVKEDGDPSYIQSQLQNDTHTWKICSWHKNQEAMQIGGKGDDQGWPDYETCHQYGAIIATAHEHSYQRTKTLTSTQNQTIDTACSDPKNLCIAPGKTFVFVSGLGGNSIRNQDRCLPTTFPYGCKGEWASIYTSDQNADYGALFIVFNYNGNPNKAHGYFKNVNGQIIDEFDITAASTAGPTITPGGITPTATVPTVSPTVTLAPGSKNLLTTVFLHGIGNGGDNVNAQSSGNMNPLHTQRNVTIELTNANNQTTTKQGAVTYNASSGSFSGTIDIGSIANGVYTVKIVSLQYLKKSVPGIFTVSSSQTPQLPPISLTTGDANLDNQLSVLDYNIILDCFADFGQPRNCADTGKKQNADITDDGSVNQFDYNLFIRELSVQSGQ